MMVVMQVGAPLYQCEGGAIRQNHGLHDLILPPPRRYRGRDGRYRWKYEVLARGVRAKRTQTTGQMPAGYIEMRSTVRCELW